jgi:hypothetical protein
MATWHTIYDTGTGGHIGAYNDAVEMAARLLPLRGTADFTKDGDLP